DSLTKSMNYVPVDAGTNSTNLLGTKDAASQKVKKDVSSLRYIALPNWVHDALLESSSSMPQDDCSTDVPESSGNSNPTATSTNPLANQLGKVKTEKDVDLHLYRSMIGSLMYLTASRPDITFAVCACARHQVTPKESYSVSDYGGATQDHKSTTGGCQFLGRRLSMPGEAQFKGITSSIVSQSVFGWVKDTSRIEGIHKILMISPILIPL
nr:hypothetical protein [Tanacetum cinerariifolium]